MAEAYILINCEFGS